MAIAFGCLPFTGASRSVYRLVRFQWANGKQISVLGKFRLRMALTICRNHYHLPKNLHDGDGYREGRKTKALTNKTTTLHARYFWYISLPFYAKLQLEMTKFNVLWRTQTHDGEFSFYNNNNTIVITLFTCQVI